MTPNAAPADPARVAHAIRESLTSVLNAVQLIRLSEGDKKRLEAALQVIARQAGRLSSVADEMTDGRGPTDA